MKQLKAIHNLFRFEDDPFRNEAEIIRNELCTEAGASTGASLDHVILA